MQAQIRALERAKNTGQFSSPEDVLEANGLNFEVGTAEDAAAAAQAAADAEDMPNSNGNGSPATVVQVVSSGSNGAGGRTIQVRFSTGARNLSCREFECRPTCMVAVMGGSVIHFFS